MSAAFDPFAPDQYEALRRQSRRDAVALGADPSLGEDALQTVLERALGGKSHITSNPRYFRTCVINLMREWLRRGRRLESLDEALFEDDREATDRRLFLLGKFSLEPEEADEPREEILRRRLSGALGGLEEHHRLAVLAQIRGWIERLGGSALVKAHEESWGVDLGRHVGTAGLAVALGEKPATVASWAHRGMKRLAAKLSAGGEGA